MVGVRGGANRVTRSCLFHPQGDLSTGIRNQGKGPFETGGLLARLKKTECRSLGNIGLFRAYTVLSSSPGCFFGVRPVGVVGHPETSSQPVTLVDHEGSVGRDGPCFSSCFVVR